MAVPVPTAPGLLINVHQEQESWGLDQFPTAKEVGGKGVVRFTLWGQLGGGLVKQGRKPKVLLLKGCSEIQAPHA